MNKFFFTLISLLALSFAAANSKYNLTIHFAVANTIEGHDFLSKFVIGIDGKVVGETIPQNQSIPASFTLPVAYGRQNVTIRFMANINGLWEERTAYNHYTADKFSNSNTIIFSPFIEADTTVYALFDLYDRDFRLDDEPFPEAANVFATEQALPYKYADKLVSFEDLMIKEEALEAYLLNYADKAVIVDDVELKIGKKGTSNYVYTEIKNLHPSLELTSKGGVRFTCDKQLAKSEYCWKDGSSYNSYTSATIYPNDPSKSDELYQKLSDYYDDVMANYWRDFATKDNTSEDVLQFDLQKKYDRLNSNIGYTGFIINGVEFNNDTLYFHLNDGNMQVIPFSELHGFGLDTIGSKIEMTFISVRPSFYNSATKTYSREFVCPPILDSSARAFMDNFVRFYNSTAHYFRTMGFPLAPDHVLEEWKKTKTAPIEEVEEDYNWIFGY